MTDERTNGDEGYAAGSEQATPLVSRFTFYVPRIALIAGVLLLTLIITLIVYQVRRDLTVNVGDLGDTAFVSGFNADEPDVSSRYRWSKDHSDVLFTGAGSAAPATVVLSAQGARPGVSASTPVTISLSINGVALQPQVVSATQTLQDYTFAAGAGEWSPPYDVTISSSTFRPPGDARTLGVKVDRVRLVQSSDGINWPPFWMLLWPLAGVAGLFGIVSRLRWTAALAIVVIGALATGAATYISPLLAGVYLPPLAALLAVSGLGVWQWERVRRWPGGLDALKRGRVAAAIMLAAMLLYALVSFWAIVQVDWIGHADYAENAVVARNFVQGRGLTVDYIAQFYKSYPDITHPADTWPLLQPLMIVPFFYVFGPQTWAAKLPNLFVMLALVWAVFWVASRVWDARAGLLAGLFTLVHPYFFNSVLYPINDLGFTAIFFALAWLTWSSVSNWSQPGAKRPLVTNYRLILVGALAGLLMWSKPSGVSLLVGLAIWATWTWWRAYRPSAAGVPWRGAAMVVGVAVLVLLPLLARNVLAFGQPYFSTESYDAPILRYWPYHDWEDIYKIYPSNDLPHWRWVIGGKFGYQNLLDAIGTNVRWVWEQGIASDSSGGNYFFGVLPLAGALVGLAGLTRRTANLFGMVGLSLGVYTLFVLGYWHFEGRYFQVVVPWLYMLLAWGILWLWDRLRQTLGEGAGQTWALLILPIAVVTFLSPSLSTVLDQIGNDTHPTGFARVMGWLKANSTPQDVIMTRDPWELNWYTERKAMMIPNDDLKTIERAAQQHGVTMLQLGGPVDRPDAPCPSDPASQGPFPTGTRLALGKLYCGRELPGFKLVHQEGSGVIYHVASR